MAAIMGGFALAVELDQPNAAHVFFENVATCVAKVVKGAARRLLNGLDLG